MDVGYIKRIIRFLGIRMHLIRDAQKSDRQIYIENVIEDLQELADKEYQVNIWLNTNNPNNFIGSFYECASALYDDCIIEDLLKNGEIIISRDVTKVLQEISELIDKIDNIRGYRPEEEIINDPKMQIVREKAAYALKLIKASDGSESTVRFVKVGTPDTPISIQDAFK